MFSSIPFIVATIMAGTIFLDPVIPFFLKQFLYTLSLSIKSIIIFVLPIMIFFLMLKAAVTLSKKATHIIGLIVAFVCASNFISTFLSHYVGEWVHGFNLSVVQPSNLSELGVLWSLGLPSFISNGKAMFGGVLIGLIASRHKPQKAMDIATKIEHSMQKVFQTFVWIIPFFVAGFFVKMQHDGVMTFIVAHYAPILTVIACSLLLYITSLYFLFNGLSWQKTFLHIKSMLPAAISGFSTMSSAASMPLTIMGAENNAQNKDLARSVIPATVNIHLVGDCFAIPIFAYAVLKSFGMDEPSLLNYLIFSFYFVMAKFSVAAIPGGGIIVMLPILESYLSFSGEMMSLITALYILFDPVITSANVLGNGAFAKGMDILLCHQIKPTKTR